MELDIIPPLNLAANATLLSHLASVARVQTVPYTLDLVSINIINRFTVTEYHYAAFSPWVGHLLVGEEVT